MPANNRSAVSGGLNLSLESLGVNLPYSMEAEQAVLGAAILDADIIPKMVETLRPEMFYARQNGEIFSEIVRLFTGSAPVDFVTLLAAVQDAAVFETEDAAKVYLTQLAETVPSLSHTDTYVKIIAEKYRVRQLMNAAKTIQERKQTPTCCWRARNRKFMKFARDAIPRRSRPSAASSSTPMLICRRSPVPIKINIWAFPQALIIWTPCSRAWAVRT